MANHDTSKPILVLVRRGRNNRGFSISPVEDVSNSASCADEKEIGEVIVEMLDDPTQPRVDINELLAAASGAPSSRNVPDDEEGDEDDEDNEEEYEDDDDDDGEDRSRGTVFEGVADAEDPADRLLFNIFSSVVTKGRGMSSSKVRPSGRKKKKRKKSKR